MIQNTIVYITAMSSKPCAISVGFVQVFGQKQPIIQRLKHEILRNICLIKKFYAILLEISCQLIRDSVQEQTLVRRLRTARSTAMTSKNSADSLYSCVVQSDLPTFERQNMALFLDIICCLITECEVYTGKISDRGLDSTDRAKRGSYIKDRGLIFFQYRPN